MRYRLGYQVVYIFFFDPWNVTGKIQDPPWNDPWKESCQPSLP